MLRQAWHLKHAQLKRGFVYKTHDLPPSAMELETARFVYTFGDPFDIVASLLKQGRKRGNAWINRHSHHLGGGRIGGAEELLDSDILCLEHNFKNWFSVSGEAVAGVRYDQIWEYESALASFSGIPLRLPTKHRRESSADGLSCAEIKRLKKTYGLLREQIKDTSVFGALR